MPNTLLDNLISHWSFDNTANDLHGTHHMTLVNSPTYQLDTPGAWTYSLRTISGSAQYTYTADHADWDALAGTGEWTTAVWIKPATTGTTQFLLNNWTASAATRGWTSYLSLSVPRQRVEVSNTAYDADESAISSGSWYCMMTWRTGDTVYCSINDATPGSVSLPASGSIDSWDNPLTWATRAVSPASYYSGMAQGLSIWSADIGASNRTEFYQSGSGLAYGSWSASGGGGGLSIPVAMNHYRRQRAR